MSDTDSSISSILDQVARQHAGRDDRHRSTEELEAYSEDRLSPDMAAEVRAHLLTCRRCALLALDLAEAPEVPLRRSDQAMSPAEVAADRDRLRAEIGSARSTSAAASAAYPWHRLAAALALVCLGLVWWVGLLQRQIADLSSPAANVFVVDLDPDPGTSNRRSEDSRLGVPIPIESDQVLLLLHIATAVDGDGFALTVAEPTGRVRWRLEGVTPLPDGNFSLQLPRASLTEPSYDITLFRLDDASNWEPIAAYTLPVRSVSD